MRKSKELKIKQAEIEALRIQAENEELAILESAKQKIHNICNDENVFCGIILSSNDIANIVKIAIDSKEDVKIPFNVYLKD